MMGTCGVSPRPSALVARYGELYSQLRLETLDALDRMPELINSEELKNKLLFSVVVVCLVSFFSSLEVGKIAIYYVVHTIIRCTCTVLCTMYYINECPTNSALFNRLPTELRCRNFVNKHRMTIQIGAKRAKSVCNVHVFQLSFFLHTTVGGWVGTI